MAITKAGYVSLACLKSHKDRCVCGSDLAHKEMISASSAQMHDQEIEIGQGMEVQTGTHRARSCGRGCGSLRLLARSARCSRRSSCLTRACIAWNRSHTSLSCKILILALT